MGRTTCQHTKGACEYSKKRRPNSLPKTYMKVVSKVVNWCRKICEGGRNKTNKKVFRQNIEKGSQKLFRHILTSEVHFHAKHPHPTHLAEGKKENPNRMPKTWISSEGQQKLVGI